MWAPKSVVDRHLVTLLIETTYADEVKKGKQKEFLQQSDSIDCNLSNHDRRRRALSRTFLDSDRQATMLVV